MRRMHDPRGKTVSLSFSRDSQLLAIVAAKQPDVRVWDASTGEVVRVLEWSGQSARRGTVGAVAFAPGADFLTAAGQVNGVEVWDTVTWTTAARTPDRFGFAGAVSAVAWDPGLVPALAVGSGELTSVWSLPSMLGADACLSPIASWREGGRRRIAFSGDGFFIAANGTHSLLVWNAYAGVRVCNIEHKAAKSAGPVAYSPDSSHISFCTAKLIESWPVLGPPDAVTRFTGHMDAVHALRYTPDGRTLISASADGTVRLWEAATGLEKRCFDMRVGKIAAADVSPDGAIAAVGGANGEIVVWDLE